MNGGKRIDKRIGKLLDIHEESGARKSETETPATQHCQMTQRTTIGEGRSPENQVHVVQKQTTKNKEGESTVQIQK